MQKVDSNNSAKFAWGRKHPPYIGDSRFESAIGRTQPSPPLSPSMRLKSAELNMTSPASASMGNKSADETADLSMEGFSSGDFEAVKTLLFLSASDSDGSTTLRKEATVNAPATEKDKSQYTSAPPTPPATPVVETLANRDAASWKKVYIQDQHEALRLLICSPAGIYSHIPILPGFNPLALTKVPIHHPANGAEHPSFAWAMIMILSLIPGHEMYTNNLVRTILALWPNITKQKTAELKFQKGKRTLSAQVTKSTPVIQNVKSGIDDLIDGKQYRIVRLVQLGEVVIMGPSKKTAEESVEAGDTDGAEEDSTSAQATETTEKKAPATASKKRAAEDDNSTPPKRQTIEGGPSVGLKRAFTAAEKADEKATAKLRPAAEQRLGKGSKEEGRSKTMGDVIGTTRYQTLDEDADRGPMLAKKKLWGAKGAGWVTANAGFVESNVSA